MSRKRGQGRVGVPLLGEVAYCPHCGAEMGRGPVGFAAPWWCKGCGKIATDPRYAQVDRHEPAEREARQ